MKFSKLISQVKCLIKHSMLTLFVISCQIIFLGGGMVLYCTHGINEEKKSKGFLAVPHLLCPSVLILWIQYKFRFHL